MAGIPSNWSANSLRDAINKIYSDAASLSTEEEALKMFERAGRYDCCTLIPYLNPDYNVLDFAGGIGRVAIPVSNYVNSVTIVDYSKDMINLGVEYCKGNPKIKFVQDFDNIPLPDNSFDLSYAFLCGCHLLNESRDLIYWLLELSRVTKPGGFIIFDMHTKIFLPKLDGIVLYDSFRKYQLVSIYDTMVYVLRKDA